MYLVNRIEETTVKYHDARQVIGRFIMKEQENLHHYTIDEIAAKTYTSKATVTRYAKMLGFSGWREFIRDYMSELSYLENHQGVVDVNRPFQANDSEEVIASNLQSLVSECIADTADRLDYGLVRMAVRWLENADHIMIFGLSPNSCLGELFARKLRTIGKHVSVVPSSEVGLVSYAMTSKDCAVIISYSGSYSSHSPCQSIPRLKENKVPIIGITGGGESFMRENLKCVLTISSREKLYSKIANFATEESINYLLNVLFSCLFAKHYEENYRFKTSRAKLLEQDRTAGLEEMKEPL